jgi:rhodanese-related sulfurtransferase
MTTINLELIFERIAYALSTKEMSKPYDFWRVSRRGRRVGDTLIYIWDKNTAETKSVNLKHLMISIRSPHSKPASIPANKNQIALLQMSFSESEESDFSESFNDQQAEEIAKFVGTYRGKVKAIVVHCEMGISRSAGVAAAIVKMLGHSPLWIFEEYSPNLLAYTKILLYTGMRPEDIDIE